MAKWHIRERLSAREPVTVALIVSAALLAIYLSLPYDAAYGSGASRLGLSLYTVAQLCGVVGAFFAALRVSSSERVFWSLLTAAMFFVFVYDMPWTVTVWQGSPPPSTETLLSTVLALIPSSLFLVLLVSLTEVKERPWSARMRFAIGCLIVLVLVFIGYLVLMGRPFLTAWGIGSDLSHLRSSMHATIGIGILLGTGATVLWLKIAAWKPWERFLVTGLSTYGVVLALTPVYYVTLRVTSSYYTLVHEAMLMTGPLLVLIAALSRLQACQNEVPLVRLVPVGTTRAWVGAVFAATSLVLAALLSSLALSASPDSFDAQLFSGGATAVILLVAIWLVLSANDYADLIRVTSLDPISGVHTSRHFHEWLNREVELARRCGEPFALAYFDADGYHRYADTHGLAAGQRLLKEVGHAITQVLDCKGTVARLEDNLFACVLPGVARGRAIRVAESARTSVRDSLPVTVSAGVAVFPEHGLTATELLESAAMALRWAKVHGKDRVELCSGGRIDTPVTEQSPISSRSLSHLASLRALAIAVDARHSDTRYHSRSVADMAVMLGQVLEFEPERVRLLEQAALMHDIGKIAVPDSILSKPSRLTAAERHVVCEHPVLGEQILSSTSLHEILPWVRAHHERWDGSGYPDGLVGPAIPIEARILAVCDAYDAMTARRCYRARYSPGAALQEIDLNMGLQFDPEVAEVFIHVVRESVDPAAGTKWPFMSSAQPSAVD